MTQYDDYQRISVKKSNMYAISMVIMMIVMVTFSNVLLTFFYPKSERKPRPLGRGSSKSI